MGSSTELLRASEEDVSREKKDDVSIVVVEEVEEEAEEEVEEEQKDKTPACTMKNMLQLLKRGDFFFGILIVIGLAALWPEVGKKHGYLESQISLKFGVIPVVFLLSGIGLETSKLGIALKSPKIHIYTQCFNFLFISLVVFGIANLLESMDAISSELRTGFVVMGTVPTTVSMCNIFTQQVNGNTAVSLVNSSVGNLLGIVVTPGLVLLFVRASGGVDIAKILMTLALVLILPFAVGQCLRRIKQIDWKKFKPYRKVINKICLLLIVYASFCDLFSQPEVSLSVADVFVVLVINVVFYVGFAAACWLGASKFVERRADLIACVYCGSQKTVAVGIPLLTIIFEDSDLSVGVLAFPLLIYHQVELLAGVASAAHITKWIEADPHPGTRQKETIATNALEEPQQQQMKGSVDDQREAATNVDLESAVVVPV